MGIWSDYSEMKRQGKAMDFYIEFLEAFLNSLEKIKELHELDPFEKEKTNIILASALSFHKHIFNIVNEDLPPPPAQKEPLRDTVGDGETKSGEFTDEEKSMIAETIKHDREQKEINAQIIAEAKDEKDKSEDVDDEIEPEPAEKKKADSKTRTGKTDTKSPPKKIIPERKKTKTKLH